MRYRAYCNAHPDWAPVEHEAYADAVDDLRSHQEEAHASGVLTIEPAGDDAAV